MVIERRIRLKDDTYLIGIKVKYTKKGCLSKTDNTYFDLGDLSSLIEYVENNYQDDCLYDDNIPYMNDIIYLYDRFPFISYIKNIVYDRNNNQISEICIIEKDEIENYIKENNIKIGRFDGQKSICPLLYR